MKKSIALLCFALSTGVASAAPDMNDSGAYCTQLSSDIAARSALFLTVARATTESTDITPSSPAVVPQGAYDKQLALHAIANEVWSLRTRMAYLDCAQARTFAY